MKNSKTVLIVLGGILGVFLVIALIMGFWARGIYNDMVTKDENIASKWANVEAAYERRADLIPNLVNTVKGYADFERSTLESVIEARSKATSVQVDPSKVSPEQIQQFQQAQGGLSSALSRLMVVVERYPELKANENFRDLQQELTNTENKINFERVKFNESVKDYNSYIRRFPNSIIAGWGDFEEKGYFEASEGSEEVPSTESLLENSEG